MGIYGLLPLLASITERKHLSQYSGMRAAVDAYVWLHRGAYSCSFELCQNLPTRKYLEYCMKMICMLQSYEITPMLVFDGGNLPSKKNEERLRKIRRDEALKKGNELLQSGDRRGAYEYFQRAVDVTPGMAFNLIELLKDKNIDYIVAPYEADAQLTFLSINNIVDFVISEDSDLIPYGCHKILYKLDKKGWGREILLSRVPFVKELDFSDFNLEMIRYMCILSGCDYLESISGMGLKKAHALLKKYGKIVKVLQILVSTKSNVPADYEENFKRADLTFQHQIVYDPKSKKAVPLRIVPKEIDMETIWFVGKIFQDDLVQKIARGECNPYTHDPFSHVCENRGTSVYIEDGTVGYANSKIKRSASDNRNVDCRKSPLKSSIFSFFSKEPKSKEEDSFEPGDTSRVGSDNFQVESAKKIPVFMKSRFFPNLPTKSSNTTFEFRDDISDEQCNTVLEEVEREMFMARMDSTSKESSFTGSKGFKFNSMICLDDKIGEEVSKSLDVAVGGDLLESRCKTTETDLSGMETSGKVEGVGMNFMGFKNDNLFAVEDVLDECNFEAVNCSSSGYVSSQEAKNRNEKLDEFFSKFDLDNFNKKRSVTEMNEFSAKKVIINDDTFHMHPMHREDSIFAQIDYDLSQTITLEGMALDLKKNAVSGLVPAGEGKTTVGDHLQVEGKKTCHTFERFCGSVDVHENKNFDRQFNAFPLVNPYEFHDCEKINVSVFDQNPIDKIIV